MPTTVYVEFHGTTVAFGTHTTLNSALISGSLPGLSTKEIENTTLGSNYEQSVASAVRKIGDLVLEMEFEPSKEYHSAIGSADESITITGPKLNAASTNAAKWIYYGHLTSVGDVSMENGKKPTLKLTFKINGYGATGTASTPFTPEA